MKSKNLLSAFLIAFTFIFSACHDRENSETEAVLPAAELEMNRNITYADNSNLQADYAGLALKYTATNTPEEFYFYTGPNTPEGKDHLSFKIATSNLKPGLAGSYTLKTLPTPSAGDASFYYVHYTSPGGGAIYDSGWNTAEGKFEITSYDADHQLISGKYSLLLKQVFDPYSAGEGAVNRKKVDILVAGTFKNVQVK